MRRDVSFSLKKLCAASQGWRCAQCDALLPAEFQVDHITPLADGGSNEQDNLQALCPGCHAFKTYTENMNRAKSRRVTSSEFDALFVKKKNGCLPLCIVQAEVKKQLGKTVCEDVVPVQRVTFSPIFWADTCRAYGIRFKNGKGVAGLALSKRSTEGCL